MKIKRINRKKITAFLLSFLFLMHQSLAFQVLASTITNGDGSAIKPNPDTGNFDVRPDAWNGNTGFKHFDKIDLSQGCNKTKN